MSRLGIAILLAVGAGIVIYSFTKRWEREFDEELNKDWEWYI